LLLSAKLIAGDGGAEVVLRALRELGGAVAIGAGIGIPAAFLTSRLRAGEPVQAEALGIVFLCAGLAIWLDSSFLLAGMIAGAAMANFGSSDPRPFREIERFEWPFMVLFFVLAGASLNIDALLQIGVVGIVYVLARTVARFFGGWLGSTLSRAPGHHRFWMGCALLPQAGVAIGMALVAANHFPAMAQTILAVAIGTTIIFELIGPILTRTALYRVGEAGKAAQD
jgi:Kef-type K+ transport system membrane component KefB